MSQAPSFARQVAAASALLASSLLIGCASGSPNYEARFGESVRAHREAQVINPRAGESGDQVLGMDGAASRETMQRYRESFKSPPPVINVININSAR